jgi:hypothetical protein
MALYGNIRELEWYTHRAAWRASPRHARTALAKGELDLTNILIWKPDRFSIKLDKRIRF